LPVAIEGAFACLPRGTLVPRPGPITIIVCPAIAADQYNRLSDEELVKLTTERIACGRRSALAWQ
jgi:hypothetical protein